MTTQELELHMDRVFRQLHRDFDRAHSVEHVTATGKARYDLLRQGATVNDFIPLLVYRFAKDDLVRGYDLRDAA